MKARRLSTLLKLATVLLPLCAIIPLTGCFEKEKIIEPRHAAHPLTPVEHDRSVVQLQE